jgi:hypothetical protein
VFLESSSPSGVDSDEVAAIVEDAYRLGAPKRLVASLDAENGVDNAAR